jgi:hypothetical protein
MYLNKLQATKYHFTVRFYSLFVVIQPSLCCFKISKLVLNVSEQVHAFTTAGRCVFALDINIIVILTV